MNRPNFITDRHLEFLAGMDDARLQNMIYAVADILANCPELDAKQAQMALIYWHHLSQKTARPVAMAPVSMAI